MRIRNYVKPATPEEAYELIQSNGTVIGGGAWLKLQSRTVEHAVDISGLGLDKVTETDDGIEIGSMVTLRSIESSKVLKKYLDGILCEAAGHIMGVTVRNVATIGGTVASGFGFSDLIPALLSANAVLKFQQHGEVTLESWLEKPFEGKDLLLSINLPSVEGSGAYKVLKKTSTDFPIVNAAVAQIGEDLRIAVGSRPGAAKISYEGAKVIKDGGNAAQAAQAVVEELTFGSNSRGSSDYRKQVAKVLVERCLKEVLS